MTMTDVFKKLGILSVIESLRKKWHVSYSLAWATKWVPPCLKHETKTRKEIGGLCSDHNPRRKKCLKNQIEIEEPSDTESLIYYSLCLTD